ncbi:MAG: type I 3-dehydroquinate dehydratase [Eubacterium sp.]|nr:type I 3-dehydroquinate dehydratase [Eubacterium sp.]
MEIKGRKIENGRPLICVSVAENAADAAVKKILDLSQKPIEAIEVRADHLKAVDINSEIEKISNELSGKTGDKIIIFTYRTKAEGGLGDSEEEVYIKILNTASNLSFFDIVDVEGARLCNPKQTISSLKPAVLMSYHDFNKTPDTEFLTDKLKSMYEDGGDIAKIAVMPQNMRDVLRVFEATLSVKEEYPDKPLITISMGKLGTSSRIFGEAFGSCLTFATDGSESAPGQIPYEKVRKLLDGIDEVL